MRVELVVQGFPGRSVNGSLSWSSVIYIETGGKKILFDTGGPAKRSSIKKHLARISVDPEDIDFLILSHFHDDHVRNYDYFPKAQILLHKIEDEWAATNPVDDFAFPEVYYAAIKQSGRLSLIDRDEEIFPGVHTMLLPGHTPGSMGVLLKGDDMPVTALTGDAVKNITELATGSVHLTKSPEVSAASIRKVREVAEVVIPGHDRMLKIEKDKIVAITEARDGIILPPGVMKPDEEVLLELFIPKTELPISS